MTATTGHLPDWLSPPGDTISSILEERCWTEAVFAKKSGLDISQVKQLVCGKASITSPIALTLSRVLGSTVRFWLVREANYRAGLRLLEETDGLRKQTDWLNQFPIAEMMNRDLIPKRRRTAENKPAMVEDLLRFFCVASPEIWKKNYAQLQASFRRSSDDLRGNLGAVSVWLRAGERVLEKKAYSPNRYTAKGFKAALLKIRNLTMERPESFEPKLKKLCSESGVNLVLIPAIRSARVSGVARWIDSQKPLIQLPLYGKTNDRFWFTFFHESAHILLHKEKQTVFLDSDSQHSEGNRQEQEADNFAANMLIPKEHLSELRELPHTKAAVQAFAKRIRIHPGIVVGRMQHERTLPRRTPLNDLKASFTFTN